MILSVTWRSNETFHTSPCIMCPLGDNFFSLSFSWFLCSLRVFLRLELSLLFLCVIFSSGLCKFHQINKEQSYEARVTSLARREREKAKRREMMRSDERTVSIEYPSFCGSSCHKRQKLPFTAVKI